MYSLYCIQITVSIHNTDNVTHSLQLTQLTSAPVRVHWNPSQGTAGLNNLFSEWLSCFDCRVNIYRNGVQQRQRKNNCIDYLLSIVWSYIHAHVHCTRRKWTPNVKGATLNISVSAISVDRLVIWSYHLNYTMHRVVWHPQYSIPNL